MPTHPKGRSPAGGPGGHPARTELQRLRDELAPEIEALERVHADRLECRRGCHACCVDDLSVFEVEADAIRAAFPELLARESPHPTGACAFLDASGGCRIYAVRPYVCRTQGLPLRWVEDPIAGIERRDICPLNEPEGEVPIEALDPEDCFTLGPFEGRLASLQERSQRERGIDDDELRRVPLRALFASAGASLRPGDTDPESSK